MAKTTPPTVMDETPLTLAELDSLISRGKPASVVTTRRLVHMARNGMKAASASPASKPKAPAKPKEDD